MSLLTKTMRIDRRLLIRCLPKGPLASNNHRCFPVLARYAYSPFSYPNGTIQLSQPTHQHQNIRYFFGGDGQSAESIKSAIVQHLQDDDVATADQALFRLEKVTLNEEVDVETYTSILDAWIRHQQAVSRDGPDRVHQEFHAADRAHAILERLQIKMSNISDDNETAASLLRPTQHYYDVVLEAWLRVTQTMLELDTPLRGVPQRAQRILEHMQAQAETNSSIQPEIHHYNTVIQIWGNSPEHLRGSMAENIFQELPTTLEPDNDTYLSLIRAWCRSNQDRSAFTATGHLMKMHRLMGDTSNQNEINITLEDYKTILEAWTRARDKLAPQKAFWVMKLMQKAYLDRHSDVRPDEECYRYVLATYARSTQPDALSDDVDEIMTQMDDRLLSPDTECYTFAIRTCRNSATSFFNAGTQHEDATLASKMLSEMEKAVHRSSEVEVQPRTENYNDVMQAWSTSTKAGAAIHAETLLKKLEQAYADGDENLKPDADSYRWALVAWANSPSKDKLNHAVTILSRMKDLTEGSEDDHAKPTVHVFNAFIQVCGAANQGRAADKRYNLKLAVNTVEEMRKRDEDPNAATYRLLLEACENLFPMGKERTRAVESIFRNCCQLGLVDNEVLAQFRAIVPDEVFTDLVIANTTEDDVDGTMSSKMVPRDWTRNVGATVMTVDGKKPKPLNIDSVFVVTKRVKEFRVKRLRQHKNKRLLQSGRALYVKNSRMANS